MSRCSIIWSLARSLGERGYRDIWGCRTRPAIFVLVTVCCIGVVGCRRAQDTAGQQSRGGNSFCDLFLGGCYEEALDLIDKELTSAPNDGLRLMYRGSCLTMMDRHEDAVESFRIADSCLTPGVADRIGLYLRAGSLFHVKTYSRAQQVLDKLARSFPHSRLAERGQKLALIIEKRLAEGISEANLNWYLARGTKAYDSGRPALALEYIEEYFLLAEKSGKQEYVTNPRANMSMGGARLEIGDAEGALVYLLKVPPDYSEWRAGILTAFGLKLLGSDRKALQTMKTVVAKAQSEEVRVRAQRYVAEWSAE